MAGAEATRDVLWIRCLLIELGYAMNKATPLYIDNQSAIVLASKPTTFARSKHIDIKHHIIRERVESGDIILKYIPTKQQRADVFTKALAGPNHHAALAFLRLH